MRAGPSEAGDVDYGRACARLPTVVATATVVLAMVVGVSMLRNSDSGVLPRLLTDGGNSGEPRVAVTDTFDGVAGNAGQVEAEPDWTLVLAMADAVEWGDADADGLVVDRQTLDGAVLQLSMDERQELARLLEAELSGSSL